MLRADHLQAWYGHTQALFDVSLEVAAGEVLGIVGTNGAGKTTTIRAILGLLRSDGHVTVDDVHISNWSTNRRVKKAGIAVVHEGRGVFPSLTVRENLLVGQAKAAHSELAAVLDLFPMLRDRQSEMVGSLSGGQRQMVALARVVLSRPRILLLDEPSLGLAPLVVDEIYERIRSMLGPDLAVVVVEQSIARVRTIATQLLLIATGRSARIARSDDDEAIAELESIAFGEEHTAEVNAP